MNFRKIRAFAAVLTATASVMVGSAGLANPVPVPPATGGDIPANFNIATEADDYIKRDVMIPMRDSVKLHTVIIIPKGAAQAPMILDRTPYNANKFTTSSDSPRRALVLPLSYGELAEAGYIIVVQDVRGNTNRKAITS